MIKTESNQMTEQADKQAAIDRAWQAFKETDIHDHNWHGRTEQKIFEAGWKAALKMVAERNSKVMQTRLLKAAKRAEATLRSINTFKKEWGWAENSAMSDDVEEAHKRLKDAIEEAENMNQRTKQTIKEGIVLFIVFTLLAGGVWLLIMLMENMAK